MTDYYKILNVSFGASEAEIKISFRKLANKHHPDKNGGSKQSEDTFKIILNAYETLSKKENRVVYDLKYKQYFHQANSETANQNRTDSTTKQKKSKTSTPKQKEYQKTMTTKPNLNYAFWFVIVIFLLLFVYSVNKTTTTGNPKADKLLEEQKSDNTPQSGEINFEK